MTTGPENPYGEQQPPQNPYYPQQQPGYQQPAQQPPYGYPQQPYGYQAPKQNHPSATTALVLGIIGLAGLVTCGGITLVLSPFAWMIGAKAVREIRANPEAYAGEGTASAGRIMGIIGTILLILGVLVLAAIIGLAMVNVANDPTYSY
ncbi:DUF4190 domain-containing protein [Nocardioides pyridinolyticus]